MRMSLPCGPESRSQVSPWIAGPWVDGTSSTIELPVRSNDFEETYEAYDVLFGVSVSTSCPPTSVIIPGSFSHERHQAIDCIPSSKSSVNELIGHHLPWGAPPPFRRSKWA